MGFIAKPYPVKTAQIVDANVTKPKMAALGQQISSVSGTWSGGSGSLGNVPNLTLTITTTGRPVWVGLVSAANDSYVGVNSTTGAGNCNGSVGFAVDGSSQGCMEFGINATASASISQTILPPSSFQQVLYGLVAGTYTITCQAKENTGYSTVAIYHCLLMAYEID